MFSILSAGFSEAPFGAGLSRPTSIEFAPDGRLFVAEQGLQNVGKLRIIKNGRLLDTPALSLPVDSHGERGLISVAFDPNFSANHFIYVYYTATDGGAHNRVSRFTLNGDVASPSSEKVLLNIDPLGESTSHNGGALHFGADGKLYIAVGDNFSPGNAQMMTTLKGKMLRINADGSIPADNPFYNDVTGDLRTIWALGLRNPYTFAVEPGTERLFINDVGLSTWEEINEGVAGSNYGWPWVEGPAGTHIVPKGYREPIYYYPHADGLEAAIVGAAFYQPAKSNFPSSYNGDYFFGDHVLHVINTYDPATGVAKPFAKSIGNIVDLDVGPDGALYYVQYGASATPGSGQVFRVQYDASGKPAIAQPPKNQTVTAGGAATFTVEATGTAPLRYQWQRDGINISGATAATYILAKTSLSDDGALFRCVVSNAAGSTTSAAAKLSVTADRAPAATITSPAAGTIYRAGDRISFAGKGVDPEEGDLPASAFTWTVDFHHLNHTHPFVEPTSGVKSGSFVIPTTGESSDQVFYRITLTVRDAQGLTSTVTRDVQPRKATMTFATSPAGLSFTVDGRPFSSRQTITGVSGIRRTIGAAATQTLNGVTYQFAGWSDGGAATHTISTPDAAKTYTAAYRPVTPTANGLSATYYDNADFTNSKLTRVDRQIDFDWAMGSPDSRIGVDSFSVRWTGQVQVKFSEKYTFYTSTDDGVRLWIDGKLVIDSITKGGDRSAAVTLQAGKRYDLRMDYVEKSGNARARLSWSSASTPKQVIPASQLFPAAGPTATTRTAIADAYVRDGSSADRNFGSFYELLLKSQAATEYNREGYVKFDLSNLSAVATAKVRLFSRLDGAGSPVRVGLFGVSDTNWTESGLTWHNRPAVGDSFGTQTIGGTAGQWYEWDVTDYLRTQKAGGKAAVAFAVRALDKSSAVVVLSAREQKDAAPQLVIS